MCRADGLLATRAMLPGMRADGLVAARFSLPGVRRADGLIAARMTLAGTRCADGLLAAADAIVAAAAVLGENQRQEENPGAMSAGGCALANAGRDLSAFVRVGGYRFVIVGPEIFLRSFAVSDACTAAPNVSQR